jgi:hypothetical protein
MTLQRISLGAAFLIIGGVLLLASGPAHAPTTPPIKPGSIPGDSPLSFLNKGIVVADDEAAGSPPKQVVVANNSAISSGSKKIADKKNEKYFIANNTVYPLRTYKALLTPNDPLASQWSVTSAKLEQAWDIPPGGHETTLAIIDTGIALQHQEFSGRWYSSQGETGAASTEHASSLNCTDMGLPLTASCNLIDDDYDGIIDNETGFTAYQNPSRRNCTDQGKPLARDCNRIDDDNNGYIDDARGWDFINNDNSVQAGELNPNGSGTQHATMAAGVAAATGNNGVGIAGVDWNTKILPLQALDDDSYGDTRSVGRAILYAAAQGADVISLSLGSDLPDPFVEAAVKTAIASGSVVVAAAGNDGCNCMVYPAQYPEVLAVGAIGPNNLPANFSSWGQNLDILAPGVNMTSTVWTANNQTSAYVSGINGTSFATPMVSGMLTRLLSQQPSATPLQLIAALTENVNRLTLTAATTHDNKLGYGSMDAGKSSGRMATPQSPAQLNTFGTVSIGAQLHPNQPSEALASYAPYQCSDGEIGTTPVYELSKPVYRFFSISQTEIKQAVNEGYTAQFFAYACLQQPHDTPQIIRLLDVAREFR